MRYHVLATDYDGTLAFKSRVDEPTVTALKRLLDSGRKLVLVTGRELDELLGVFPELYLFEWVVAENGGLLYRPADGTMKLLGEPPPLAFVQELQKRGVHDLSIGQVIVATWVPHETTALEVIRDQGLELQVIFNKEAVMVLPSGINKASGLAAALKEMKLTLHEVVGVGDAENDHAFLNGCEFAAAVANALPALKERADLVTHGERGDGVCELIEAMLADDLQQHSSQVARHHLSLGIHSETKEVIIPAFGPGALVADPVAEKRAAAVAAFIQRLQEKHYQYCLIDVRGNLERDRESMAIGSGEQAPEIDAVLKVLEEPGQNVRVNLAALATDAATFFRDLLLQIRALRQRSGRPHWLIVDEAETLLPKSVVESVDGLLERTMLVSGKPGNIAPAVLEACTALRL